MLFLEYVALVAVNCKFAPEFWVLLYFCTDLKKKEKKDRDSLHGWQDIFQVWTYITL